MQLNTSFEYWILLHHIYTTTPFCGIPGQLSSGDQVMHMLKTYWPDYDKGDHNIFQKALSVDSDDLETAKKRASMSCEAALESGTDNPTTRVHELITYLQKLAIANKKSTNYS